MTESSSVSSRFGTFDSLSSRLSNLDERLAEATPPAVVMPILRKPYSGVTFEYNPNGWNGGDSAITTLFLGVSNFTRLPPWTPNTTYVLNVEAITENGLIWTPTAFDESDVVVATSGVDHPRFFRSTLEAADGDIWWIASEPDESESWASHIVSLDSSGSADGRVVVIYVTAGDELHIGASEPSGLTAPGMNLLQEAWLSPGEAATYIYDAQAKTWVLIDIRLS